MYLGGWVNVLLFFKTHITKKCQAAMVNLVKITKTRKHLTEDAIKTLSGPSLITSGLC